MEPVKGLQSVLFFTATLLFRTEFTVPLRSRTEHGLRSRPTYCYCVVTQHGRQIPDPEGNKRQPLTPQMPLAGHPMSS